MNQYEYVDGENMKNGLDGGLSEFKWLVAMATQQNKYEILFSFTTAMTFLMTKARDYSRLSSFLEAAKGHPSESHYYQPSKEDC